jgi:hypothetical protein
MLTVVHIPFMKYQLQMYKLYGLNPYSFHEEEQTLRVSNDFWRRIGYRISIMIHAVYCVAMMVRLYTKSFDLFFAVVGLGFFTSNVATLLIRLNWRMDDGMMDTWIVSIA